MSSFIAPTTAAATKTPYTKFLEGFVFTFAFPMPQPRPSTSDYKAAFKTYSKTSADTLQLMEDLTNHRIQMLSVVSTNGPLTEQLSTLELYLQDVHNLHESLMVALDAKQNVACDREIGFEWTLYLNSRPPFRSSSLVFEMIMLYHMKAQMHYRMAQQLLTTDYASFAAEAGKQFLTAASIYDLLHTNISNSKWDRKFHPKEINPPECSPAVCTAMSFYCRSRAQATALLKAQVENKVSAMVKTRLALGAAHLSSQSCDAFAQSLPPYTKKETWVFPLLLAAVGSDRELNRALAQHYLAMHCADPAATSAVGGVQLGQALSCTALAKLLLQEQRFPFYEIQHPGLPKITQFPYTGLTHLRDVTVYLQSQWDETAPTWERENRMIYFQPQPRSVEEYVVPTPAEAIVANPAPFKPVEPLIFPFIDPPKALSVFSSFFGLGGSKSSASASASSASAAASSGAAEAAAAVPPEGHLLSASMLTGNGVPDTRELTDEEFARELQRRMNLEASAASAAPAAAAAPAPSAPPLHGAAPTGGAPPRR